MARQCPPVQDDEGDVEIVEEEEFVAMMEHVAKEEEIIADIVEEVEQVEAANEGGGGDA